MHSRPLGISVVIPTFNRREPLLHAVGSVKCRDPARAEVIVVDDGSEENPATFLPGINEAGIPVRCFRQTINRGPQAARNLGIRRAHFAYVAFLDSDDAFHPDKLDVLLEELDDQPVDVVFHPVAGMVKYNRLARWWWRYLSPVLPFRWWAALYNPVATPGLVIRRCRRLGAPRIRYCEDYFFLLRYCTAGTEVRYVERELSVVRRGAGTSGGLSGNRWRMRRGEFDARLALLRERTLSGLARYIVGSAAAIVRIASDLGRGRYLGRSGGGWQARIGRGPGR